MLCSFLVFFLSSFSLSQLGLALPGTATPTSGSRSIILRRRPQPSRDFVQWGEWAKAQREGLITKYAGSATGSQPQKRGSGTNLYVK
jgi:hypothetical protein